MWSCLGQVCPAFFSPFPGSRRHPPHCRLVYHRAAFLDRLFKDGVFHWWAASYGSCIEPAGDNGCATVAVGACGFQTNHNVTLFTSTDLVHWENRGVAFHAEGNLPPNSVLFAPKTVYNPHTQMYVMWFNYIVNTFSVSLYGVAVSPTPEGPFVLKVDQVKTLRYSDDGDEGLFVGANPRGVTTGITALGRRT